jgi:MFS family permease
MFTIASALARSLIVDVIVRWDDQAVSSAYQLGTNLRWGFIALFGLAAGFIADRFGRKLPIIFGLATFGVGYILLGFSMSEVTIIIYYALSGITWGLFFVIFLVIPGDLSIPRLREKFYALGYILPLTGILALSVIPVPNISDVLDTNLIAQILGICLFLSMYPVFRAKETLTEKKIREREMKEHAKRIGKLVHET